MATVADRQYEKKKETIEMIASLEELSQVAGLIIKRLNMREIKNISEDFISTVISFQGLGNQNLGFILLDSFSHTQANKLDSIINSLLQKSNENTYSKIYVISKEYVSKGFVEKVHKAINSELVEFWDRDELINKIDYLYPEFWKHGDQELIAYEKMYAEELSDEWSFGRIKQLKSSYDKLYNIFIEPKIFHKVKDKEANGHAFVSVNIEKLRSFPSPIIIEGDSGSGKTRLIREIGHYYIRDNSTKKERKFLPVFINITRLMDTKGEDGKARLIQAIATRLNPIYDGYSIDELLARYSLVLRGC